MASWTIEAIEDLVASPGWAMLEAEARAQWEGRKAAGLRSALNDTNDLAALAKLRQIEAASEAVAWVLRLPHEALRHLRDAAPGTNRRPPLPSALATQSRRGGL